MFTPAKTATDKVGVTTLANVPIITLQFSFSNAAAVPKFATMLAAPEKPQESAVRRERKTGVMFIEPTMNVSLAGILESLTQANYALVVATYQERVDQYDDRKTYHMVRFEFAQYENAALIPAMDAIFENAIAGLQKMCAEAMWRVRGFVNPFYRENLEVFGYNGISLNFEARNPFVDTKGCPIEVWQNGPNGRFKAPLRASKELRINGGIKIVNI